MRVHYLRPLDYLPAGTVEDLPEGLAAVLVEAGVVEVAAPRRKSPSPIGDLKTQGEAARLATLPQGARTDLSSIDEKSQREAAALLNVGKHSVERARIRHRRPR